MATTKTEVPTVEQAPVVEELIVDNDNQLIVALVNHPVGNNGDLFHVFERYDSTASTGITADVAMEGGISKCFLKNRVALPFTQGQVISALPSFVAQMKWKIQ